MRENKVVSKWVIMCKHWSKTHKIPKQIQKHVHTAHSKVKEKRNKGWGECLYSSDQVPGILILFIGLYLYRYCTKCPETGTLAPHTQHMRMVENIVHRPITRFQRHRHNNKNSNVHSHWFWFVLLMVWRIASVAAAVVVVATITTTAADAAVAVIVISSVDLVLFFSFFFMFCIRQAIY